MTLSLSQLTPELAARAAEGDRTAIEEIVRALQRPLYNLALRMLLLPQDAEDATQEALLRIVTHLGQYRAESRFATWAWRIAVRRILDFREQRGRGAPITFEAFAADLGDGLDEQAAERAEDAVLYRQLKTLCSRALLQCLDADHRVAYILGEIVGLASPDAAEILDIEPATLRKRLSRAREQLADFLGKHCGVFNPEARCACHRRSERALQLGRIRRGSPPPTGEPDLPALRAQLATVTELRRVAAYYCSDADVDSRRDFVTTMRSMLGAVTCKEPS
jgi:RNA polymerase sigma factor (sigma-70 family)